MPILNKASRDAILSNNLIKYSFMGKRAHCEVFRRHSDVPPFFAASPDLSPRRPYPAFPPEGRSRKLTNTSAVNSSPLLGGVGGVYFKEKLRKHPYARFALNDK